MLSGKYAAEAVVQAAKSGLPAEAYNSYIDKYAEIIDLMRQARFMRYLLFPRIPQTLFLTIVSRSKSKGIIKKYMDLLTGTISYHDYLRFLFSSAAKRILPFS